MAGTAGGRRPESMRVYAERQLKTLIATGTLTPGSRLSPEVLAVDLELSHIPVREALASLASAGYVEYNPGRGYMVRQLSSEDSADIYRWREVLETEAYRIAVPELTDDDLEEMHRLLVTMGKFTDKEDRLEFIRLNREFHFVPFQRTGSERLLRFLNALWDAAAPYASLEMTDSIGGQAQHEGMMPLFEAHDTDGVIEAMNNHRTARLEHVARWEANH
jgi:DNA-binding GntR family transcriptional regulator